MLYDIEKSSNHKSQHIYRNFVNASDRKIIGSKGDHTKVSPMAKDDSYTAALESKMGDIKTQMSNPLKIGGQGTLFYQPNYMPSSGKGIPNNIQRSEISPTGIYKDKLDKQTQISQQVNFYYSSCCTVVFMYNQQNKNENIHSKSGFQFC